jgi:hypothetical protein
MTNKPTQEQIDEITDAEKIVLASRYDADCSDDRYIKRIENLIAVIRQKAQDEIIEKIIGSQGIIDKTKCFSSHIKLSMINFLRKELRNRKEKPKDE